jgi:hypothetical protein
MQIRHSFDSTELLKITPRFGVGISLYRDNQRRLPVTGESSGKSPNFTQQRCELFIEGVVLNSPVARCKRRIRWVAVTNRTNDLGAGVGGRNRGAALPRGWQEAFVGNQNLLGFSNIQ